MVSTESIDDLCPCGSQRGYDDCCGRYHRGELIAPTAEALMRSRYSAFSRGHASYLVDTLHPSQRQPNDLQVLRKTIQSCTWSGLEIVSKTGGGINDTSGSVEFIATFIDDRHIEDRQYGQLLENSFFTKENGRWFYVSGDIHTQSRQQEKRKIGRNDPCWCGSGKKLKKCHGRQE